MRSDNANHCNITKAESEECKFFRYAIVIEYIGTSYAGSQIQPNTKTVQSELENVLKTLTGNRVKTIFSGRTDSGVHSKGQVVHFDLNHKVDILRFVNSMNALLPQDISVSVMTEVEKNFHSQKSAAVRWYRYKISNRLQRSVWSRESLLVREKLDVEAMNKAIKYLEGSHNFLSFRNSDTNNPATDCTIYLAQCKRNEAKGSDDYIIIDIAGNRFLYSMVRIIVGTLLKIGKGLMEPCEIEDILKAQDRIKAGPTASPEGLTLMCVGYSKEYNLLECINKEAHKDENIFCKASRSGS